MAQFSTGTGDGGLEVEVDAYGAFGSSAGSLTSDAFYNPVGSVSRSGTVFESFLGIRFGNSGSRTFLATENLSNPGFDSTSVTNAQSSFSFGNLDFDLVQNLGELLNDSNQRTGSRLNQNYTITNTGESLLTFEIIRYVDGDLQFDGSIRDGGGLLNINGLEVLFETDQAGQSTTDSTFVGLTAEGGTTGGPQGTFEVDSFSGLKSRIESGQPLDDIVTGDSDDDGFVDAGAGYDITLALRNVFTLEAGESTNYNTSTTFGSGTAASSGDTTNQIIGDGNSENLTGSGFPENINSGGGDDTVDAGGGDDIVDGGDGNDTISGGDGNDNISGGAGEDNITVDSGNDTVNGGSDNDDITVTLEAAAEIEGEDGDEIIDASGTSGGNSVDGGVGLDILLGGSANDKLEGGDDDDIINGNEGVDRLYGEGGSDTFILESGEGRDLIFDFDQAESDSIQLGSGLTFDTGTPSSDIALTPLGSNTLISEPNGDQLAFLIGVNASDLNSSDFDFAI